MREGDGVGRPTKLTDEVKAKVLHAIRIGAPFELAAASAGICERTLHNWREWGQDGREPYAEFLQEAKLAEGEGLVDWLGRIGDPDDDKWQRWAWKAERRFPQHFALRARLEHTGADGGPIRSRAEIAVVDTRALAAAAALLDEAEAQVIGEAEDAVRTAVNGRNGHAKATNGNGNGNGNGHH